MPRSSGMGTGCHLWRRVLELKLTIDNIAALYFADHFDYFKQLDSTQVLKLAGLLAAMFGSMNLFARALGGWLGDKCGSRWDFQDA